MSAKLDTLRKGDIASSAFVILAAIGMILMGYFFPGPVNPLNVIRGIILIAFLTCFTVWNYYDNLKNQTSKRGGRDFMAFVGMVITGALLTALFCGATW